MTASNTVTTVSTTRSNMGADSVLTGFLKDVYLNKITDTCFFDDSFTRLIQPAVGKIDATGRRFIQAFSKQWAGGVGPIAEGGDFRDNVPVDADQGYENIKYSNLYFSLSGPAIATAKAGAGSYVDSVAAHLETIMRSYKMDIERILMGSGDGHMARVDASATTTSGSTIAVDGPAFFDTMFVQPGQYIEIHQSGAFGTERTYDGSTSAMTVASVSKGNKATSTNGTIVIDQTMDGSSTIAANDIVTRKNCYTSTTCLETNGLANLISDGTSTTTYWGAETGNNFVYCWPSNSSGKDRTSYTYLQSQVENINAELDEDNLLGALLTNIYQYQGNPNMLIVSPRAMLKYFGNSKGDRRFNTMEAMDWTGGYKGAGIQLGDKKLMLTTVPSMTSGYGYIINTNDFAIARPPGWSGLQWVTSDGGAVLRQKEGSDEKFASAVDYWSFVCWDPGRQCKLYGITET